MIGDFLASKNFSLGCAVLNAFFCINSIANGSWIFGIICGVFCGLCTKNYLDAR